MTTGALIFAYNNENIDYLSLAAWSADNIRRHLGIPVAVVTDHKVEHPKKFDKIIINNRCKDFSKRNFLDAGIVTWHNTNRMDAYSLSPWDYTILLDADYVVASADLKTILDSDQDMLTHCTAYDITGCNDFSGLNFFGAYQMPMHWATVVAFRKSLHAQLVFESMSMIRNNWRHYLQLYQIGNSIYRNDYALTIARGITDGHVLEHTSIPWGLASVLPDHTLTQIGKDHYRIDYTNSDNQQRWIEIKNQDFHAMGKKHLGDIVASQT